jgi:DnaJ like chaperone protein
MAKYGKWIGGGLGWALGGPIGAVLGFVFGSMFDSMQSGEFEYRPNETQTRTQPGDFSVALLILSAAVMKADGRVLRSELDYVKRFFLQNFGEAETRRKMLMLREILRQDIDLAGIGAQINHHMSYAEKLQLIHFLYGISSADGREHPAEIDTVKHIASLVGVAQADFQSIRSMFVKDTGYAYRILEISPDGSDEEIKKAYRKMALKYHPDKVSHLGEEVQNAAKEKFQELNAAYNVIKKQRGMA